MLQIRVALSQVKHIRTLVVSPSQAKFPGELMVKFNCHSPGGSEFLLEQPSDARVEATYDNNKNINEHTGKK